jgi:hypothetical protein
MNFQVVIKAEARKDVIEAYHFYETKLTSLGDIFWNLSKAGATTYPRIPFLRFYKRRPQESLERY